MFDTLGQSIKEACENSGKTIVKLCEELPAGRMTVYRYRRGENIYPDSIIRLSEVLEAPQLLDMYCHQCEVKQAQKRNRVPHRDPKKIA